MLFFYTSKRTPFTLQKGSFYTPKGLLLHNKCTPFGMQKGYIYFSSVIFGLFSCCLSAFQPQILYQVSDEILALAFEHIYYRNLNHCVASRLLAH